ncbi:MAG: ATP-binding protein [Candidatus Dormibacteraeota bacterium]|nr:ATP-binding protein [Candidatus Dormibacteraeota bacterium]
MRKGLLLGRRPELLRLEEAWRRACQGRPQLVIVDGRRRVGKTYLLAGFAAGKPAIWYGATHESTEAELARLARAVRVQSGRQVDSPAALSWGNWRQAVRFLGVLAEESPLLVVLDGYDRLLRSDPLAAEAAAYFAQDVPPGSRLMLVLVGPQPDLMTRDVPDREGPVSVHVEPFDAATARRFLPRLSPSDFLEAYAACGGYPLHLMQWEEDATTEENLLRLAGTTGGVLLDDAEALLREQLPDAIGYTRILAAVGRMQTRYSEILGAVAQRIEHPLEVLVRSGLLRRSVPVGAEPSGRAAEYEFNDTYLAFWFSVLYPSVPDIEAGGGQRALQRAQPAWAHHVERVFQEVARDHARRLTCSGGMPADLIVGRWWSAARDQAVDVLGLQGGRSLLVGRARWLERPLGHDELSVVQGFLRHVPKPAASPLLALWGRHGVSTAVRSAALGFDVAEALEA